MKYQSPIQMYRFEDTYTETYGVTYFNAVHVKTYFLNHGYRYKDEHYTLILTFPVKNFFRKLFGKALIKPKRRYSYYKPKIYITFINGSQIWFKYANNKDAEKAYEMFDTFMKQGNTV